MTGNWRRLPKYATGGILDWDTPVTWIDTSDMDFKEEFVGETFGRINKEEAHLLLKELEAYILRIGGSRILEERIDFGLISPYKAQVQYLRGKIKRQRHPASLPQPDNGQHRRRISGAGA